MNADEDKRGQAKICERVQATLDDWLDGLLDHESVGRLESHLAECPVCEALFERHRAISANLVALGQAAEGIAGVSGSREAESGCDSVAVAGHVRRLTRLRSWVAVAAVLVMFVSAGLYMAASQRPAKNAPHSFERKAPITVAASDNTFSVTCSEGRMVVPIASSNPRIHIVWLYDEMLPAEPPTEDQPSAQPASEEGIQGDNQ